MSDILICIYCQVKNCVGVVFVGQVLSCVCCGVVLFWLYDGIDVIFEQDFQISVLVLVDFWVLWCGFCCVMGLVFEDFVCDLFGKVWVVKVNVDENLCIVVCFEVCSIFMLLMFKDGEEVDQMVGVIQKVVLWVWVEYFNQFF